MSASRAAQLDTNVPLLQGLIVGRRIGSGGPSDIFQCSRQAPTGTEPLTLKVSREMHRNNHEVLKAFEHEAEVLRRLEHPLLPRIRGYVQHQGLGYLLYDFIDGTSLDWLIAERSARIGQHFVTAFRRDFGAILGYLSRVPLVHGDISAKKIIVTQLDSFHLVDFVTAFDPTASVWAGRGHRSTSSSEDMSLIDRRAAEEVAVSLTDLSREP